MAHLLPCITCRRHLRSEESACPFCGAQQPPGAVHRRERAIPRDASRATIFALGLTLAGQACGGRSETLDDKGQVGAGASSSVSNAGSAGARNLASAGPGSSGEARGGVDNPETCAENPLLPTCHVYTSTVPPYGISVYLPPASVGDAGNGRTANGGGDQGTGAALDAGPQDAGLSDAAPNQDASSNAAAPNEDAGN
jgi:hypothetical protein